MSDTNIDWGRLNAADPVADYAAAYRMGRAAAAGGPPGPGGSGGPSGSGAPAGPAGPPGAMSATATGPGAPPAGIPASIQVIIASMTPQEASEASRPEEILASVLHGLALATPDPAGRLAMARYLAARNPRFGIHPDSLTPDDLTDQALAAHTASVLALKRLLDARARTAALAPFGAAPGGPAAEASGIGRHISNFDLASALEL